MYLFQHRTNISKQFAQPVSSRSNTRRIGNHEQLHTSKSSSACDRCEAFSNWYADYSADDGRRQGTFSRPAPIARAANGPPSVPNVPRPTAATREDDPATAHLDASANTVALNLNFSSATARIANTDPNVSHPPITVGTICYKSAPYRAIRYTKLCSLSGRLSALIDPVSSIPSPLCSYLAQSVSMALVTTIVKRYPYSPRWYSLRTSIVVPSCSSVTLSCNDRPSGPSTVM